MTSSIGTRLGVTDRLSAIDSADIVLVAGSDHLPGRPIDPALVEAVRSVAARTGRMASICTGSFILAQAGLLDGRRATTHWHDARLLARAFRDVTVEPDAIFVRDGDVFTSAGFPRVSTWRWHWSKWITGPNWCATSPGGWSSI